MYMRETAHRKNVRSAAPASKFNEQKENELSWAAEHVVGVAKGADPEIIEGLKMNFTGECTEVGMYLAMSRRAGERRRISGSGRCLQTVRRLKKQNMHAKFAELLGEVLTPCTKTNLETQIPQLKTAPALAKWRIAKKAKELGLDAIHRHGSRNGKGRSKAWPGLPGTFKEIFWLRRKPHKTKVFKRV